MIAVCNKGATVVHVPPSAFCVWLRQFLRPWGSAVVAVVLCCVPLAGLTVALCVDARQAALCLLHRATVGRRWRQVWRVQFRGSVGYPVAAVGAL